MSQRLLFLSFDVEADGPAPGLNSMLSFGFVGIDEEGQIVFEYEANLEPLSDAKPNASTMEWWSKPEQAMAWEYVNTSKRDPRVAFMEMASHIETLKLKGYQIRCVAWPIAYDWQWINYYFHRFIGRNPLGYSASDIGSYAWGHLGTRSHDVGDLSAYKDPNLHHTHRALDDAREQGMIFYNLWKARSHHNKIDILSNR